MGFIIPYGPIRLGDLPPHHLGPGAPPWGRSQTMGPWGGSLGLRECHFFRQPYGPKWRQPLLSATRAFREIQIFSQRTPLPYAITIWSMWTSSDTICHRECTITVEAALRSRVFVPTLGCRECTGGRWSLRAPGPRGPIFLLAPYAPWMEKSACREASKHGETVSALLQPLPFATLCYPMLPGFYH